MQGPIRDFSFKREPSRDMGAVVSPIGVHGPMGGVYKLKRNVKLMCTLFNGFL